MKRQFNPKWVDKIKGELDAGEAIDETQTWLPCIQWLIKELSTRGRPYNLYNLGAGVKRIVTDTDICPCCKRKL